MRQLNDEPKPVYKVGFIREKGKATAREVQWSPEAGSSLLESEGWGFYGRFNSGLGGFLIGLAFQGLSQVSWFGLHLSWGKRNNLESILLISPVADLYLSFRLQECRPPSSQDAGTIIALRGGWDTHSSALGLQTQQAEIDISKSQKQSKRWSSGGIH
jgi:hypothetical protein